jgi:hypothetical protein
MACRFALPLLSVLLYAAASAAAWAHELGTIRTYATFARDGTYRIDLMVDREHLPPGFGSSPLPGRPRSIEGLSPFLEQRLGPILQRAAAGARIVFDEREVTPRVELAAAEGETEESLSSAAESTLRLQGRIPPGSKTFTWSNTVRLGSYLLTLASEGEEEVERQWLTDGQESRAFRLGQAVVPPTRGEVLVSYFLLGYTHILPKGQDHILFVLGIFLLSTRLKPVLLQVTAFTVAHTLTLALSIYGVVSLPSSIVEPAIALSIVYVAVENLATSKLKPWRILLVFGFGLLHGMGFAGVLSELGLPRSERLAALMSFNVGVEAGQLTVIAMALLLAGLPFRRRPCYRRRVVVPASLAIALVGLYWAVQRVISA